VSLIAELLKAICANMVIGDYESVGGNKGAAATRIETDTGSLQMFEPLRGWLELILFLKLFQRRRIERPHSFVCKRRSIECDSEDENRAREEPAKYVGHGRSIKCGRNSDNCKRVIWRRLGWL
jgi:hypothetical protein